MNGTADKNLSARENWMAFRQRIASPDLQAAERPRAGVELKIKPVN
jgi:hypothetical protein